MLCSPCFALCAPSALCVMDNALYSLCPVLGALCSTLCVLRPSGGGPSGDATGHRFLSSGRAVVQDPSVFAEWSGRRAADTKTSVFARDEDPHGASSRVLNAFSIEPPGASWVRPGGGALGRRHGTSIFFEWEGRRSESLGFFRVGRASRRREENTVKMQGWWPAPFQFSSFGRFFYAKSEGSYGFYEGKNPPAPFVHGPGGK